MFSPRTTISPSSPVGTCSSNSLTIATELIKVDCPEAPRRSEAGDAVTKAVVSACPKPVQKTALVSSCKRLIFCGPSKPYTTCKLFKTDPVSFAESSTRSKIGGNEPKYVSCSESIKRTASLSSNCLSTTFLPPPMNVAQAEVRPIT